MPIKFYRCSRCKLEYRRLDDAIACEKSHAAIRRAKPLQYTIGAYPFTIRVMFTDGKEKTYVLEDMAHTLG